MRWVVLTLALFGAGCAQSGGEFPFETYEKQPGPSSAAGLDGLLKREGSCLYVDTEGVRVAILLPSNARWNPETETLSVDGKEYRVGENVSFGGQLANEILSLRCEGQEVFIVG